MKQRKFEISYINILLCLGVIMIHVLSEPIGKLDRTMLPFGISFIVWRMLSCAVPGFIFLSGLKLSLKPVNDWKGFYKRRFTSVVVPYLIWMPIYYYCYYKMGYYAKLDINELLTLLVACTSTAHFYFIAVIVQFYLLHPIWQRLSGTNPIIPIILAGVITYYAQVYLPIYFENNGIVPFYTNDRLFTNYLLYWILGIYIGRNYDKFLNYLKKFRYGAYAIFVCLTVVDLFFSFRVIVYGNMYLWLYYVNMAYCVFAILSALAFFAKLTEKHSPSGFIICLDKSSYYIYLSHLLVLTWAKFMLDKAGIAGALHRLPVIAAATFIIPIAVCMLYTRIKSGFGQKHSLNM